MKMKEATIEQEILKRLSRMETRVTRGFESLGVDTEQRDDWISVDDASRTIYLSTDTRSLIIIRKRARDMGATQRGKSYDLVLHGDVIGTMII